MRTAHPLEATVGIDYYVSDADGTGGKLRTSPEDFRVAELESFDTQPVAAAADVYTHLVIRATLENWDTNDFANELANRLGISRERVSWAGTKDKRAITTQLFSIDGISPADLPDLSGVEYEVLGRAGRPILFGDLAGNAFEVVVREPERPAQAEKVLSELQAFAGHDHETTVAVPNYFGHQRFGSIRPITHEVGLAIVRSDWKDAALTYVAESSPRERERTRTAREFVAETHDWQAALDRMPGYLRFERSILHRLAECDEEPADFRAALETLPTNLQQLFVNAAQSYVFNRILSRRLDRGLPFDRPVAGDVVCFADTDAPDELWLPDTDRKQEVTESRVDSVTRHCERGRAFVTAPLVGTETTVGGGEPGEITRSVLDELDLEPEMFDLPGEFDSTGTRRAILVHTALELARDPLSLSFSLPKGSYATVLLREFLKTDPAEL